MGKESFHGEPERKAIKNSHGPLGWERKKWRSEESDDMPVAKGKVRGESNDSRGKTQGMAEKTSCLGSKRKFLER